MGIINTDLGETRESARRLRYEPSATNTATNVQSAIDQVQSSALLPGGFTPTVVTAAMSPYAPLITDTVLLVSTTGGPVSIQMPLSSARLNAKGYVPLTVKDDVGNSDVSAIAVLRSGAELIDGLTSYPIDSKYTAVTFMPKAAGGYDAV